MEKRFYIIILFALSFISLESVFSQAKEPESSCKKKFSKFYNYINGKSQAKDYQKAYDAWLICFKDCPKISEHLYKYGSKILYNIYSNSNQSEQKSIDTIADELYHNWIKYYPKNSGKIYNQWANYLKKTNGKVSLINEKVDSAYKNDPLSLSARNISIYFRYKIEKEKNIQKNLDLYDDLMGLINTKIDSLSKQLSFFEMKEGKGEVLSEKEKLIQKNNTIILKGLGRSEVMLDVTINQKYNLDCDNLESLYEKSFDRNKTNKKWLQRALSRLFAKDCRNDFTKKLIEAQTNLKLTIPEALIMYQNLTPNVPYVESSLKKLIDSIKDPYEKADIYYKIAHSLKNRNKSLSRQYAYKALKERPNLGKAYLLIATLYARSANQCGNDEFSKRMVYIAAADKAKKAREVDPSVYNLASKYIKNYLKVAPQNRFTSSSVPYKIECWIGETVKIP